MDPVTHGLIGASAASSTAAKEKLRWAALAGGLSAMLADLDVFISDPSDPLLNLEIHRQFSHSLIFIPAGALIAAGLLWWFLRKRLSFGGLYLFCLLGYATSGIADTLTSYGTKLLWPFLDERFSWNIISIFDPLFSLGIVAGLAYALYRKEARYAWIALGWAAIYLLAGLYQQERGLEIARELADERDHQIERIVVKPTLGNIVLWSARYESSDTLYADGIHLPPFSSYTLYEGESAPLLNWKRAYASYKGTTLYRDIHRFDTLSEGFLIKHPHQKNIIGDGRYAMLPTEMDPLWGIEADTSRTGSHVPFRTFRDASPEVRSAYIDMLLGKDIENTD